jgi:tRNA(fMet)-specific endonuclease VapC
MYLLDTDTLIYALKGDPPVVEQFKKVGAVPMAVSIISFGELLYGAMKSARPEKNLARVRHVAELYPVIEITMGVMETFASLKTRLERKGTRLDDFDLLIASTALFLNYRLVTCNERHFNRIPELTVENWAKTS